MTSKSPAPDLAAMDLMDLRAFCQVVDLGSITAAAKALGETKGTVSRRLTRLERALDAVLVQRSPRQVQATDDGAMYRARIGQVLELLDEANSRVRDAKAAPAGHLRVTAPTDMAMSLLIPRLALFGERYPAITVELILTEKRLDFDAHQIDVAIRAANVLPDSALVAHRLLDIEMKLYASTAYLARYGTPRRFTDLVHHRVLVGPSARRGHATLRWQKAGAREEERVDVVAAVSSADYFACKEAAAHGAGIAVLPTALAQPDVENARLVPVLEAYSGGRGAVYLVHHATRFLQPKVRVFRDYFRSESGRSHRAADPISSGAGREKEGG